MKCTKKDCSKPAEYVVDGQSLCKDHKNGDGKEEGKPAQTMGDVIAGTVGDSQKF